MRLRALFLAPILLLAASVSVAQAPPANSAWRAVPSAEDLRQAYPADAAAKLIGGRVLLACDLMIDGRLERCAVVAETPAGRGFGVAALSLSDKFRMEPKLQGGQPVAGGRIRFPIVFSLTNQATKV